MPEGLGTALKPAWEPIVVARKPLIGTVSANVLAHGTGALNIDATRVGDGGHLQWSAPRDLGYHGGTDTPDATAEQAPYGRWPANVVLSHTEDCVQVGTQQVRNPSGSIDDAGPRENAVYGEDKRARGDWTAYGDADGMETVERWACVPECPVRMLDSQTASRMHSAGGAQASQARWRGVSYDATSYEMGGGGMRFGDSGGASRFFYTAKASRAERNAGLDGERSTHPTVKPIDLMRWLVRLVTPSGGTVLDPFLGSGTTGCAAVLEGFHFVGVERDEMYVKIAEARIAFWQKHPTGLPVELALRSEAERGKVRDTGQLGFDV